MVSSKASIGSSLVSIATHRAKPIGYVFHTPSTFWRPYGKNLPWVPIWVAGVASGDINWDEDLTSLNSINKSNSSFIGWYMNTSRNDYSWRVTASSSSVTRNLLCCRQNTGLDTTRCNSVKSWGQNQTTVLPLYVNLVGHETPVYGWPVLRGEY